MASGTKPQPARQPVTGAALEVEAMTAVQQTFDRLELAQQARVLAWANTVYGTLDQIRESIDGGPFKSFEDKYPPAHAGVPQDGGSYIP